MTRNRSLVTALAASLSLTALAAVLVPTFAQEPTAPPPAPANPQPPANPTPAQDPNAPPATEATQTLDAYDTAAKNPRLKNFIKAVDAAGLKDTLKGKSPVTIIAPSNMAFSRMPEGAWDDLQKPENHEKLVTVLKYHVLPLKYTSADLAKLDDGTTVGTVLPSYTIKVTNKERLKFNGVGIVGQEIPVSNGTIFIVDSVLVPPTDAPAQPAPDKPAPTNP